MKVLLSNKEENGTEHIIGFRSKDIIINKRGDIKIPLTFRGLEILEKDIKELKDKIRPIRGLRREAGIIEEVCDMNKEDVEEVLHKFDKTNKIDFESEISKRQENDNKKVETFNSVIKDNIEGIEKLFKTDYSEFIIGTILDGNGYLKLILKKTILPEDKGYEFGYIEERGDSHNLKEHTINRLRNFITNIYCGDKI